MTNEAAALSSAIAPNDADKPTVLALVGLCLLSALVGLIVGGLAVFVLVVMPMQKAERVKHEKVWGR